MQLPLPAGSFKHPSRPSNYQLCVNYFGSSPGVNGRGAATLLPTMGSQLILDSGRDPVRMLQNINGDIYTVIGNTFYSVEVNTLTLDCSLTAIGTLNTSAGTVIATNNPTQIILLDGDSGYIYNYTFAGTVVLGTIGGTSGDTYNLTINGVNIFTSLAVAIPLNPEVLVSNINANSATTKVTATYTGGLLTLTGDPSITSITVTESGTGFTAGVDGITVSPGIFSGSLAFSQFEEISDPNFIGGSHVVYVDGYFIYNEKNSQRLWASQPNEGRLWDALDVTSAESNPDNLIALGEYKGEVWAFGTDSIEVYSDTANAVGFPFSKQVGSDIGIGCKAPYSVTNVNDLLVWIDSRGFIVQSNVSSLLRDQSTGYTLTKISDEAIDTELATYERIDDAIGTTYVDRGHVMLEMTFPSAERTWVFDYNSQQWHERATFNVDTGEQEHSLSQYCTVYKNLLISGGNRDGKLFVMSQDYYYDNDQPITRFFTTSHINQDFKEIGIDSLELKLVTGFGGDEGYLANTQTMMKFSSDSGYTWSNELNRSMGKRGQYDRRVIWNRLGTEHQWLFYFKITAPIQHAIVDLSIYTNAEI